jgi:trans-2,3-dihydro-3-hydroxyanthranilate isomerase
MNRNYLTTDVFTNTPFEGNPLAVVFNAEGLSTRQMQKIAAEFGYAETTFVLPAEASNNTARIRIFTPIREMPFAGHPNIGTAFALAYRAKKEGMPFPDNIVLEQIAGNVQLSFLKDGTEIIGAELVTPKPFVSLANVPPQKVAQCLSIPTKDIVSLHHAPQIGSVGMPFVIVELASRDALRACTHDANAFRSLLPMDGASAIYAYTRDVQNSPTASQIEARLFTLRMTEDAATGGAAAALAALLSKVEGREDLNLLIAQGSDIGRPSLLKTAVQTEAAGIHVKLGGECVTMMEGSFYQPNDDE